MYTMQDLPSEAWAASPLNGVDLSASAGIDIGPSSWHSRMTVDLWSLVLIIGSLAVLWILGGVVFRRVNII